MNRPDATWARVFIGGQEWRFAKTMPQWPHWYIVRREGNRAADFDRLASLIEIHGEDDRWGSEIRRYLRFGDFKYWVVGYVINRSEPISSAEVRGKGERWLRAQSKMRNRWEIPSEIEQRLRRTFRVCAYCRGAMEAHLGVIGCPGTKATIEHLNRHGPFYWSEGLKEEDLVIACARCNASRGKRRLVDWFSSTYCIEREINSATIAGQVQNYLRTRRSTR